MSKKRYNLNLNSEVVERFDKQARKQRRSRSAAVEVLMEGVVNKHVDNGDNSSLPSNNHERIVESI